MALGITVTLTKDVWVQLATDGDDFVIQNVGNGVAILKYSDGEPTTSERGHLIVMYDGISSSTFGSGNVWGKADGVSTLVEVTK